MRLTARRTQAYAWLLLNTVAFGATIPIVKWGLGDTSPFRYLMYRFMIAVVIAVPILWYYRKSIMKYPRAILKCVGVEIVGCIALGILYFGLNLTTSLEANLILTTGPVFITIGGLLYLHEKVTKREWFGLGLATSMTLVLTWLPSLAISAAAVMASGNLVGNMMILFHNVINVIYAIAAKKTYHKLPKMMAPAIGAFVGIVAFSFLAFWESQFEVTSFVSVVSQELHNPVIWFIAGFSAIITTYVGLTSYLKGQDLIEVSEASLFVYLQPAVYIPLSFFLLGETLMPIQMLCFVFVMVGVLLAEWKPRRAVPKPRRLASARSR